MKDVCKGKMNVENVKQKTISINKIDLYLYIYIYVCICVYVYV